MKASKGADMSCKPLTLVAQPAEIAVIDADGGNRRELTNAADAYPAWQPTE